MTAQLEERVRLVELFGTYTGDWTGDISYAVLLTDHEWRTRTWACERCDRRSRTTRDVIEMGSAGMRGCLPSLLEVDVPAVARNRSTVDAQRVDLCEGCAALYARCWECGPTDEGVTYSEALDVELCPECWREED